jgi:hypothetical protein
MNRFKIGFFALITVVVMMSFVAGQTLAGTFKDRDGVSHTWTIGASHELVWDGSPYLPFGVSFQPESLSSGASDEAVKADAAKLDELKKAGITDVVVRPKSDGIASLPTAVLQRTIDLLESKGFKYGIDLYDGPYAPLEGYVINPSANRMDDVRSSGVVTRSFPGAKSVVYVLCDPSNGEIQMVDESPTVDDSVSVPVTVRANNTHVLLFYPSKTIDSKSPSAGFPDLWSDYGLHRDRLVASLSRVKFGKGLRFFLDPFTSNFAIRGESNMLIPTSKSFSVQYAAWLSGKYESLRELSISWGLTERDAGSYAEAARYIPLWHDGRGVGAVYDPSTGKKSVVDTSTSLIWADFLAFRLRSAKAWMDGISDVVKSSAVDVPVVFSTPGLQPIYIPSGPIGYDGLAVLPSESSPSAIQTTGEALSVIERSSRKVWMLSCVRPEGAAFGSKEELFSAINTSRSLGSKGFLVDSLQGGKSGDGLSWLAQYASMSRDDKAFASYQPSIVYYPKGASHTGVQRLGGSKWWIPTDGPGTGLDLGNSLAGYYLENPENGMEEIYVWSLRGKQTIHLVSRMPIRISRDWTEEILVKPTKKGILEFEVDETPMIVRGITEDLFVPVETAMGLIGELEKAVNTAAQKHVDATVGKLNLDRAKDYMRKNQVSMAADTARSAIEEMKRFMAEFHSNDDLRQENFGTEANGAQEGTK